MPVSDFDVLIVGGGLAGLSLACALRASRLRLALVEQRPPRPAQGWDARVYAISPANRSFLQEIGIWKHLPGERLSAISAMKIIGDRGSELDFSAYETGIDELGWIVESSLMACELWENAKRQGNLSLFCPAVPAAIEIGERAASLDIGDDRRLTARLLVAADGRDSWVRGKVGMRAIDTPYGELGVVANFDCQVPHRGVARQWFRHDGVLAWLPLAGDRISIVWSAPEERARQLLALPADALAARVAAAGDCALGELRLLTPAAGFPLRLLQIPQIIAPRLVLVGDAAHGIHPLSGHGINLGFQDARALASVLAAVPEWQDVGHPRFLRRYQRQRREETLLMQATTHALHHLFRTELPGFGMLRNAGMNLTNALPVVKNLLVRYAVGAF
ncbi:MAG: UbiH/UbiF family hydroxylase [Candidatus Accumulibacter sp.]|uniref:UbiH/UbiF family hydroxylase n=1 Tax=Accumulibacter sp. TaxID=2053492 RepID=UPI001A5A226D|nr:UbiH/UbiF family hydroxylase [Accumulibacter sp.]MBL8392436.1 UbiH/UbiF family hydroxylase [Accumulibacter sp.]HRD88665.1 UbiH/UbiF family hydroxylase [Accumulibacter sp.]